MKYASAVSLAKSHVDKICRISDICYKTFLLEMESNSYSHKLNSAPNCL